MFLLLKSQTVERKKRRRNRGREGMIEAVYIYEEKKTTKQNETWGEEAQAPTRESRCRILQTVNQRCRCRCCSFGTLFFILLMRLAGRALTTLQEMTTKIEVERENRDGRVNRQRRE